MSIERNPTPPKLSAKAIRLITELCFRKDDKPKKTDCIFLFSSSVDVKKHARAIEELLSRGASKKVFISGGLPPKALAKELGVSGKKFESEMVLALLKRKRFPGVKFYSERKSSNTYANVTEMLKKPAFRKCKSIFFIFKSHAAGRGYLTLRKFFPKAQILQKTVNIKYKKVPETITKKNWHTFPFGRNRVWGEFLRIKRYGSRGEIEYRSVKKMVERIERETKFDTRPYLSKI